MPIKRKKERKEKVSSFRVRNKMKMSDFRTGNNFSGRKKRERKKCITYYAINLATIRVGMGPKSFPDFIQQKTFLQNKREKVFALVYFLNVKGSAK